jgi:hypothetical protein
MTGHSMRISATTECEVDIDISDLSDAELAGCVEEYRIRKNEKAAATAKNNQPILDMIADARYSLTRGDVATAKKLLDDVLENFVSMDVARSAMNNGIAGRA